jgi:hypothetical protein
MRFENRALKIGTKITPFTLNTLIFRAVNMSATFNL